MPAFIGEGPPHRPEAKNDGHAPAERVRLLVLAGLILAIYGISPSREFVYDDKVVILQQEVPRSLPELAGIFTRSHHPTLPYYRPVTIATFVLQKALHGEAPRWFHWFNAALAACAGVLAYKILRRPAFAIPPGICWIGATVFALHPVASSVVYPANGRETLLPGVLALASFYEFSRGGRTGWALGTALLGLALFSKEQVVVLAVLLVLADLLGVTADPPGRSIMQWTIRYAGIVLIAFAYFAVRHQLFGGRDFGPESIAHPAVPGFNAFHNPLVPLWTPLYALQASLVPFRDLVYEPTIRVWFSPWRVAIVVAAVFALAAGLKRHWGTLGRTTLFWFGWFVVTLLPTANIISQDAAFDERYLFLSTLPVIACVAGVVTRLPMSRPGRRAAIVAGFTVLLGCSALTLHRARYFANDTAFFSQWLRTQPDHFLPHYLMGTVLYNQGRLDEAAAAYRDAIRLRPEWPSSHLNLGIILADQGRLDEAILGIAEYVRLNPGSAKAHYTLGWALTRKGRFEEAAEEYLVSLDLDPANAETLHNLGYVCEQRGDLDSAITYYREVLRLKPGKANTLRRLEAVLAARDGNPSHP